MKIVSKLGAFIGMLFQILTSKKFLAKVEAEMQDANLDTVMSQEDKTGFVDEFIKFINNGCKCAVSLVNGFVIGDIFRHRAETGDRRLYLHDNFNNWLIKPFLEKVIPIRTDLGKISKYVLPKDMNDAEIQKGAGKPGSIKWEVFLNVLYLLIFQKDLAKQMFGFELSKDKYYVFHVELPNETVVVVVVYWYGGEWRLSAHDFGGGGGWGEGCVFLSFATA